MHYNFIFHIILLEVYMKKNNILRFTIFSGIFVMILGTLLHFTFEWSGNSTFVASFSAVNESTWEHLKLLFFPMLLTTILGYFLIGKNYSNFLCARLLGILTAIFIYYFIFLYLYWYNWNEFCFY